MNFEFLGAVVFIAVSSYVLKSLGARTAAVFSALSVVLIFLEGISRVSGIFSSLTAFTESEYSEAVGACLKIVGVGYLFGSTAEVCRALSEEGIAKGVESVGRVEIILIVLPFVKEIIDMGAVLI